MANIEKKKQKLRERIKELEDELTLALTKKTSSTAEINLPAQHRKIAETKKQLTELK